jgi:hypothetical protein
MAESIHPLIHSSIFPMPSPFSSLERVPGLRAVPVIWRELLGPQFAIFKSAFLQSRPDQPAKSFPCPNGCGTWHQVFQYGPDDIVATCRCESSLCEDLKLTPADIIPLELNWAKVGAALCRAFGCEPRPAALGLKATRQIGSWSADPVPVILTLQSARPDFRRAMTGLVARLRRPFILLAPTSQHLDAPAAELLANANAAFFALDTTVTLTEHGSLQSRVTPGQLFARFNPQSTEPDEDVAQRAFALVQQFDSEQPLKSPTVLTVFRLYCIEALSAGRIARKFRCSKPTVLRRLELIKAKTGVNPDNLRTLSPHLSRLEEEMDDPRARRIHRKRMIYGDDPEEEEG